MRSALASVAALLVLAGCFPIDPKPGSRGGGTGSTASGGGAGASGGSAGGGAPGGGAQGGGSGGNLPPTLDTPANETVDEDAQPIAVALTNVSSGSAQEDVTQFVALDGGHDAPGLLAPLRWFTDGGRGFDVVPLPNANGVAHVSVSATDNGFPSLTTTRTFTVTVRAVNDAPTFTAPARAVVQAPGPTTVPLTGVGPGGGADEASQPLSLSVTAMNTALITGATATLDGNGLAHLSLSAPAGAEGATSVTVTLSDGQSANSTRQLVLPVVVSQPPAVVTGVTIPSGTLSGCVTIGYTISQPTSLAADVRVEVERDGKLVPGHAVGAGLTGVTTSPGGVAHALTWSSDTDFPDGTYGNVKVRVVPSRLGVDGTAGEGTATSVSNAFAMAPKRSFGGGPGTFQAVVIDVDKDGVLDVVTVDSFVNGLSILHGNGDGGFAPPRSFVTSPSMCGANPSKPFSVNVADYDNDGRYDFTVANENCETMSLVLGLADGGVTPYVQMDAGNTPLHAKTGDFDHDGYPDVAMANYVSNDVTIFLNNRAGGFRGFQVPVGLNPNKIEMADFNNDGHLDLVTANATSNDVTLLLGNGDGGFWTRRDFGADEGPRNMGVGDFNADGLMDVATANPGPANTATKVSVLIATDAGFFAPPAMYTSQTHPRSVGVGDLNGDGLLDFATGNVDADSVSVFLGRGDGTFWPGHHIPVGGGPHSVAIVDLDGDGKPEIVTGNTGTSDVTVLVNQTKACR
ncbi:MAG: VCBS repeat-containing protein [Myxococcaceae bacterium]|nr:VCBS repeat-containing protein [Myxococcaceae bacterium]